MNNYVNLIFNQNQNNSNPAYIDSTGLLFYKELEIATTGFANYLLDQGIKPRDYVIIAARASMHWPVLFYGCIAVGVIPVPVEDDTPIETIKKIVRKLNVKGIISDVPSEELSDLVFIHTNSAGKLDERNIDYYNYDDQELVFALTTSGTTGDPKLVAHRHKIFKDIAQFSKESDLDIDQHSVIMCTSRPNFGWSVSNNLIVSPSAGATCVVYDQKVDPIHIMNCINNHKVTHIFSFPLAFNFLVNKKNTVLGDHLKVCVCATEPLPLSIAQRFQKRFGRTVFSNLGWSEMFWFGVGNSVGFNKENTIGRPLPSLKTKVLTNDGRECQTNEPGVLWIGGENISPGYLIDGQTIDCSEFESGWWNTNDVVFVDDDGFYHFITRNNRYVKIHSQWVSAPEIEELVMSTNLVQDCTVVFDVNQDDLPIAVAYAIPNNNSVTTESIRIELVKKAKSHMIPRRFYFVSELPRTARNKKVINKNQLDEHYKSFGLTTT